MIHWLKNLGKLLLLNNSFIQDILLREGRYVHNCTHSKILDKLQNHKTPAIHFIIIIVINFGKYLCNSLIK